MDTMSADLKLLYHMSSEEVVRILNLTPDEATTEWYGLVSRLPDYPQRIQDIWDDWAARAEDLHVPIETLREKFADARQLVADDIPQLPPLADILEGRVDSKVLAARHVAYHSQIMQMAAACNRMMRDVVLTSVDRAVTAGRQHWALANKQAEIEAFRIDFVRRLPERLAITSPDQVEESLTGQMAELDALRERIVKWIEESWAAENRPMCGDLVPPIRGDVSEEY